MPRVRRIAHDYENLAILDCLRRHYLGADSRKQKVLLRLPWLQGVRQEYLKAFVIPQWMLLIPEILRQLQVCDRIGGDQVLESEQVLQNVLAQLGRLGLCPGRRCSRRFAER